MKKYLLTGEKGIVGSNIVEIMQCSKDKVTFYDPNIPSDADICIHLASKLEGTIEQYINSNLLYLQEIIAYCTNNNINKFIFFSGARVYGNQNKLNIQETDCFLAPNTYALTKLLGEKILFESNLKVLILRLPGIIAKNSKTGVLSFLYSKLKNNEKIKLSNGDKIFNNFISVDEIFKFIKKYPFEKSYEIINLAVRQELKLLDIVQLIQKIIDSKSEIIIDKSAQNFMNLSIDKAINKYNYTPLSSKETIIRWCESLNV